MDLLFILVPGRSSPVGYPPPSDVRYGELIRLTRRARQLGRLVELADLEQRVRSFFDVPPSAQLSQERQLSLFK